MTPTSGCGWYGSSRYCFSSSLNSNSVASTAVSTCLSLVAPTTGDATLDISQDNDTSLIET